MSALSKIEALNAIASGKLIGFSYSDRPDVEVTIDKTWSIESVLNLDSELYIKRETLTLAEIQFTKPAEPHDLEDGQEIYIVMPTCILRTQYDSEHGDICLSVANGFAQLDEENAKLQLQAFGKTFGNMITDIEVKDGFNDKPKKRTSRSKKVEPEPVQVETIKPTGEENVDLPWNNEVPAKLVVTIESELQLHLDAINVCESAEEIETTLRGIENIGFSEEQLAEIEQAKQSKLAEFNENLLNKIQDEQYQNALTELLDCVKKAKTPTEVNALYKHTMQWTEEQRKPFMSATHKRLEEINTESPVVTRVPPSLQQRIEGAVDLGELKILEEEVLTRDSLIQPKLMGFVKKRRFELENQASPTLS